MSAGALRLLTEAHDALAGMSDSDLDHFEDEEEELETVPMQYAARKVMAAMQLLQRMALVPVEAPASLAPLLTGYSLADTGLSKHDREAIEWQLRTRWTALLAEASKAA